MKKIHWILLVVGMSVIILGCAIASAASAFAGDRYNRDLYEGWRKSEDGINIQCAMYKDHLDCNWDRYNKELEAKNKPKEQIHG